MKTIGFTIIGLILNTIVLSILKLFGVIEWKWLWVTCSLWIPICLFVASIIVMIIWGVGRVIFKGSGK